MKTQVISLALAAMLAGLSGAAAASGDHHHAPAKGGVLVAGKEADYELVARPELIQLYVSDHGKPRDVSRASARLTLLAGTDKQEVELKPTGDRLEAAGTFKVGPGTKAVAVVTDGGKTLGTARFTLK